MRVGRLAPLLHYQSVLSVSQVSLGNQVLTRSAHAVCLYRTAVVLTPIKSLTYQGEKVEFGGFEQFQNLYNRVRAIQNGEYEDTHNWMMQIGD